MRSMILQIQSQRDDDTAGLNLFQGVDFCQDMSQVYINRVKGEKVSSYIFTFYAIFEAEAIQMIKGLGVYLKAVYGEFSVEDCFTSQWFWNGKNKVFDTPETRQMKANVYRDPNMALMMLFEQEEEQEKERVEKLDNSKQRDMAAKERLSKLAEDDDDKSTNQKKTNTEKEKDKTKEKDIKDRDEEKKLQRQKNLRQLRSMQDPDLECKLPRGADIVQEIDCETSQVHSVASSITMESEEKSNVETSADSNHMTKSAVIGNNSAQEDQSQSSIKTMNTKFFEKLFLNTNLSEKEKRETAEKHIMHAASKYAIAAQRSYELLLQQEKTSMEEEKSNNIENDNNDPQVPITEKKKAPEN